jgi:phosphate transport system permease protein
VLGFASTGLAFALGLPVVYFLHLYLSPASRVAATLRFFLDVLWGIPSIVYGAFGFTLMVWFGLRASLFAAIVTVGLLVLPIMIRTIDEVFKMIPKDLYETAYALGSTRLEVALKVASRKALPGILTAVLISFGRGIGDAASVLFTAGFTDSLPSSLWMPVATLPLAIFFQLGTPFPEVQQRGYASAFVLTVILLVVSLAARFISSKRA